MDIKLFNMRNKIRIKSLKKKFTLVIFICCTVLLSLAGIIISSTVNDKFMENEQIILHEKSLQVSNKAEVFFERYISIVEQMAQDKNIQNFLTSVEKRDDIFSNDLYEIYSCGSCY